MEQHEKHGYILWIIVAIVLTAILVGGGVYYWQNKKATDAKNDLNNQITNLQNQINTLKSTNSTTDTSTSTNSVANTPNTNSNENIATFVKDGDGYHGTLTLTGYIQKSMIPAAEGSNAKVDYYSFVFTKSNSDLLSNFLQENSGNSFVTNNSIGLGCLSDDGSRIYSTNMGNDGQVSNALTGEDLQTLLNSNINNQIQLKITKPVFTSGSGAPACYSHFRDFEIVK